MTSYLGEKVYGNFKRSKTVRAEEQSRDDHDDREGNSKKHLDLIRKLPCCTCPKTPGGQAHHIKTSGQRGMGMRSPDRFAVPMCPECHLQGVERAGSKNEIAWFRKRGIEALDLAVALWTATGSLPQMTKIVIEHKRRGPVE